MAVNGITGGKVTIPVSTVEFLTSNIIELNECSDKATAAIASVTPWKI